MPATVEAGMNPISPMSLAAALSVAALTAAGCAAGAHPGAARPPGTAAPAGPWTAGPSTPAAGNAGSSTPAAGGPAMLAASGGTPTSTGSAGGSPAVGPATVTAQGVGTVSGTPDTMTIGIGVSTTGPHAADALSQNNSIAAAVQAALRRDGVPAADIATTGLSLQQNWNGGGPSGYAAFDEVTATVHDPAASGHVIDDALAPAGDAGRLDEVQLTFADSDPLMAAARTSAVQSARAQATQMAAALGGRLGPLVSLTAAPTAQPSYFQGGYGSAAAGPSGVNVPVQPGTQKVTTEVTGVWQVVG